MSLFASLPFRMCYCLKKQTDQLENKKFSKNTAIECLENKGIVFKERPSVCTARYKHGRDYYLSDALIISRTNIGHIRVYIGPNKPGKLKHFQK